MANKKTLSERVKTLVTELLAEEAALDDGPQYQHIDDVEDAMVRIGDLVAREFGLQKLQRLTRVIPEQLPCPDCDLACEQEGWHERELISSRGEVPLTEATFRCHKCRRNFFPSESRVGT